MAHCLSLTAAFSFLARRGAGQAAVVEHGVAVAERLGDGADGFRLRLLHNFFEGLGPCLEVVIEGARRRVQDPLHILVGVLEVDGGLAALAILKKTPISCVLLDISMPVVSGLDVLEDLRRDQQFQEIKVVAYTAYAEQEDVSRLLELGFDAVLIKPLTSAKLLDVLKDK